MNILIIEDQPDKREQIIEFVKENISTSLSITEKESLRGALKEIVQVGNYDLILLDMSMPNFDPSPDNLSDSSPESFAGRELLEQMKLRDITIPVIVITQYSSFEGGLVTLESLSTEFEHEYGDYYMGSIYFNSATDTWKDPLLTLLRNINE